MEKTNTSLRKETAEALEKAGAAERKAKEAEENERIAKANLALENEVSEHVIVSLKEAVKSLEEGKAELFDQLENIAFEATAKERYTLMKQYVAGEHIGWTSDTWIQDYESLIEEGREQSNEDATTREETQIAESDAEKEKTLHLGECGDDEAGRADI